MTRWSHPPARASATTRPRRAFRSLRPGAPQAGPAPWPRRPRPLPRTRTRDPAPGAPSYAQVRRDLRQLERYQRRARAGGSVGLTSAGRGRAPLGAPTAVAYVVAAGNSIACALPTGSAAATAPSSTTPTTARALSATHWRPPGATAPLTSGELMKWGSPGPGRWMTVYANPGHVFMVVGGLRFDTSGRDGPRGSRWQSGQRGAGGFAVRHWPGLDGGRGAGAASPMDSTDRIQTVNDSAQHSDPRDSAVSSGVIVQRKPSIARRGAQIALVATARKLSVVFWHLLTREEDYAFGRPTLTRRKLRALELKVGTGWRRGRTRARASTRQGRTGSVSASSPSRPRSPIAGSSGTGSPSQEKGCGRDTGGRIFKSSSWRRETARQGSAPEPAL